MCACSPRLYTRDSKQYLQQLMIPESVMGVYRKGEVVLQVTIARYLISVKTENNGPKADSVFLTHVMFLILIFTSHHSGTLTRHQQLHL